MSDTPSTAERKRALRALAAGDGDDEPTSVVDEATTALRSVERAARFLANDGEERLARAVVRAVRDDDAATVRRGRRTFATLRSLKTALDGERPKRDTGERRNDSDAHAATQNHFHPARGTVLGGRGKRGDR